MKKVLIKVLIFTAAATMLAGCSDTTNKNSNIIPNTPNISGLLNGSLESSGMLGDSEDPVFSENSNIPNSSSEISRSTESSNPSESSGESESPESSGHSSIYTKPITPPSSSDTVSSKDPEQTDVPPRSYEEGDIIDGKLDGDKSYTVKSGDILRIGNGDSLLVNGRILCNNGGKIVVEKGGSLMVNGEIELSGDLELGGELALSKGSKIYGEGMASISSFDDINCEGDFTARIIPPAPVVTDGVTTVGGVLIVNKKIALPETYGSGLDQDALASLREMRAASGHGMPVISGFRSYQRQVDVFAGWCAKDGEDVASTYSARPGHSEHQSGLAMDITSIYQSYGNTPEGKWVAAHCHEFGFIVRYPLGKDDITGYMYEPWHLRYLGKSTAKLVHDSGLTLDEFLCVES